MSLITLNFVWLVAVSLKPKLQVRTRGVVTSN